MVATVVLTHTADFSSPVTILALVFIALGVLFIFLYNSMAMRRTQLDRQIELIRMILRRRAELAAELIPGLPSAGAAVSIADLLCFDERTAELVVKLPEPDREKLEEYRKLESRLAEALEFGRSALLHYNRIVEQPEARRIMKLFRFKPREKF
jgi:hypothetical protein